jgi:Nucleotidyl transferase AbiEii toxin, Type IV TA system
MAGGGQADLSAFHLEVARLFFRLPASKGFLLAGGAALLFQHLTARPTEELDFFTTPERGHVPAASDALEAAARQRGWTAERIHDSDTFCRMVIWGGTARSRWFYVALVSLPGSPAAGGPVVGAADGAGSGGGGCAGW